MKKTQKKKLSLAGYSVYSIILYATILLSQIYIILQKLNPPEPAFFGSLYLPMLINGILLVMLIAVGVLGIKKHQDRETRDERAVLNNYKAGYIAKYISVVVIAVIILLVKDFSVVLKNDVVGNVLSVLVISISITEIIHNIAFIILEKR